MSPNGNGDPLTDALAKMLIARAQQSSTYVDKPHVAQMQGQRQQNAFEQAKEEDYYNKVRALNELRARGTNPSQMFQKANNFVGDFVTGNTPQQMTENVLLNAIPVGKLLSAIAPLAKVGEANKSRFAEFMDGVVSRMRDEGLGQEVLDKMVENKISPQSVGKRFWDETYFNLDGDTQKRFKTLYQGQHGYTPEDATRLFGKPSHLLDLGDDAEYLEGSARGFVVLMDVANKRFAEQAKNNMNLLK